MLYKNTVFQLKDKVYYFDNMFDIGKKKFFNESRMYRKKEDLLSYCKKELIH